MRTSAELREGFLSFFESKDHLRFPSFPLVPPPEDPSTLFISAGMQPLKPYFSGAKQPPAPRFTTVQKCLRAGGKDTDLDEVGMTARHASMFEMLGNFSFGDYFKDGAVDYAWEFVTEHLRFEPDRLWATVFAGDPGLGLGEDEVSVAAWRRKGIPRERIVPFPRSDNFWGPAGETGPCGPCSELHYDRGPEHGCGQPGCGPNCERCDRYIEFWNLVFMEFDLGADGSLTPLPKQNIDTGLGLERCAMLVQGVDSIFDTDGFRLIMDRIAEESGVAYGTSPEATKAHRVLCDHGRGVTFLVAEGVTPSNEGRGYVLRRLIRRSVVQARRIGLPAVYPLPRIVVEQVGPWYPEVVENAAEIERVVRAEEERFRETLERGIKEFEELAGGDIGADDAFRLAATYGFPIELTVELARERGHSVDVDGYRLEMERHREISARDGGEGARPARRRLRAGGGVRVRVRRLREGRRAHATRRARGARRRHVPGEAAGIALLPDGRWPGDRPGVDRARRRPPDPCRARGCVPLRRRPGAALPRNGVLRRRPRTGSRPVERPLPDDGEPHRHAPASGRPPRSPRGARHAGRLGGSARQAALRLHPHRAADGRGARGDRATRQQGGLRERYRAHLRDDHRRGARARRDGALR